MGRCGYEEPARAIGNPRHLDPDRFVDIFGTDGLDQLFDAEATLKRSALHCPKF
jgi:hypothetical protein